MFDKLLYIGRNTLRHEDEPTYDKELHGSRENYASEYPQAYPHVFIAYDDEPVTFHELFDKQALQPTGSSSVVVGHQKLVRDKHSLRQVNRWRDSFKPEKLKGRDIDFEFEGVEGEDIFHEISNGAPFVILKPKTVDLKITLTVEDMREKLIEIFNENGLDGDALADKPDATIRSMYNAMK